MAPQEIFKIEHSETLFPSFLETKNQFPRQGWSSLKFSLKSKIFNENGQLVGEGGGMAITEFSVVNHSVILKNYNNKKIKKPSNIGRKVPDLEWETTGQNPRPLASNENPVWLPYFVRPVILQSFNLHTVMRSIKQSVSLSAK